MAAGVEHELALPIGVLRLVVSSASDLGMIRKVNEDSLLVAPRLFLVADGMGGHAFGDRASQSVVATFASAIDGADDLGPEVIVQTIHDANTAVIALGDDDESSVSGTTLSGLALVTVGADASHHSSHHWMAFNVGDSRLYSWDGRNLEQVTVDHSAVQELLDLGQITPLEASSHPQRNVVTRAIGVHDDVEPDLWLLPVGGRQVFLACSDGLTKELDDDLIAAILADTAALAEGQTMADRLVAAAIAAGGADNVTVIVIESELVGTVHAANDDTNDRGMPHHLEQTRPRK